ncbi:MAG: UDP-N-acetylglucosamine 2-epimerase (non-hydrolyzing), partial [Halanaerobacter sp.]
MGKLIKIMSIIGTRPEAIKIAPVLQRLDRTGELESILVATAQHRELLDEVLNLFGLEPDYDLDVMSKKQSLTTVTIKILQKLKEIIMQEEPDLILVHGDTTTTFAAAVAAFYQQVKIVHIEAGLRSYDKYAPYPEEINRKLTSGLADLHFAPTEENYDNLLNENIDSETIFVSGNTVIDTVLETYQEGYQFDNPILNDILDKEGKIILVTAHRRENLGQRLRQICRALDQLVEIKPNLRIVFPVHPNPKVREVVYNLLDKQSRIALLEPLGYKEFINLLARSDLVLTDSGGLQEEAPALDKPVLVLREKTERQAGVKAGTLELVGTDRQRIVTSVQRLLDSKEVYRKMAAAENPYGDGEASRRIVDYLKYYFDLIDEKPI